MQATQIPSETTENIPAGRLPFDHPARIEARRVAAREARSSAYATLVPGDVIFVDEPHDDEARRRGYCPAHFAQVVPWTDGDMGVRGLLGGGCSSGPLPRDSEVWFLVGHAAPTYVAGHGQSHIGGGFYDPAADLVRRLLAS